VGRHKKPKEEVYDWSMNSLGRGKPKRRKNQILYKRVILQVFLVSLLNSSNDVTIKVTI
jgi:hypothetical protein